MSDSEFPVTDKNRVKRSYKRACYDKQTIYNVIDSSALAHVAYVINGEPFCTPTCHWRHGNVLYWHGSSASRMIKNLKKGIATCVTVSHIDGFVLARSSFHHSVNYRSAMCFGTAHFIENQNEKRTALEAMINRFFPGRTKELRPIKMQELKATSVIAMEIESAAAKCRAEGVSDDEEDYSANVWSGVIPLTTLIGKFEPEERLQQHISPSRSLSEIWQEGAKLDDALLKAQRVYEK